MGSNTVSPLRKGVETQVHTEKMPQDHRQDYLVVREQSTVFLSTTEGANPGDGLALAF